MWGLTRYSLVTAAALRAASSLSLRRAEDMEIAVESVEPLIRDWGSLADDVLAKYVQPGRG